MNILIFTHARPEFLPPVILDASEIVAGPNYTNLRVGKRYRYLHTPGGQFDYAILGAKLQQQRPDLILVHADATAGCLPRNLPDGVARVLLVGDTHHLHQPLQTMLLYAQQTRFDAIVVWNRQHAHFFQEMGLGRVFWMPGLTFAIPEVQVIGERRNQICFFGQLGNYHPRRKRLVESVIQSGIPMVGGKLPRSESLELASLSSLSLNASLNGELNLRVFECASMGSMLITDQLSRQTGLEHFFPSGDALITYSNEAELSERIRVFLGNPELASGIAERAQSVVREYFTLEKRRSTFFALLNNQPTLDAFRLIDEPRCQLPCLAGQDETSLILRVKLYEFVQELHRIQETVHIIHFPSVHPLILSDLSDLIRLEQVLVLDEASYADGWQAAMSELGVDNLRRMDPQTIRSEKGDLLIVGIADLDTPEVIERIRSKSQTRVVLCDWIMTPDIRIERALIEMGYRSRHQILSGLFEVSGTPSQEA